MITPKDILLILVLLLGVVMLVLATVAAAMRRLYCNREKNVTDPEERVFCQKSARDLTVAAVILALLGAGIFLLAALCTR